MLTSVTNLRSPGGHFGGIGKITQVFKAFLKGHIEAILDIHCNEYEQVYFVQFSNVTFCDTSKVISMILDFSIDSVALLVS